MKKCLKVANQTFLCLGDRTLFMDRDGTSTKFEFLKDIQGKILDFSFKEPTQMLRVVTTDGDAISTELGGDQTADVVTFSTQFICASICKERILAVTADFRAILINFKGKLLEEYGAINELIKVHFCLLTSQLKALADSSMLYVQDAKGTWKAHKFRDFLLKELFNVNRQQEFGVALSQNTRIVRPDHHTIFRNWAKDTVSLLQCPCAKRFYAHLGRDGILRIGDNEADYSLQEEDCTGICWELGVLWSRSSDSTWHRLVLSFGEALYDLRTTKLEGMESDLTLEDSGKVLDIVEALIERPSLSCEVLRVLPAIAQNLTSGIYVNEAKQSLDAYIRRNEPIQELLGQIDLALSSV